MMSQTMTLEYRRRFINELEIQLNTLRCTWPCGIRKLDDERDAKIERLTQLIAHLRKGQDENPDDQA